MGKCSGGSDGGGYQCVTSLTLSIPLSVLSSLSPKCSTLPLGVQAGWVEALLAWTDSLLIGQLQGKKVQKNGLTLFGTVLCLQTLQ